MICPKCQELNITSKVFHRGGTVTCIYFAPFYDEKGAYHHHDANRTCEEFHCSNGHKIIKTSYGSCECGWTGGETEVEVYE